MMRIAVLTTLAALLLGWSVVAFADQDSRAELLAAHNKYRAEVGLPPLRWSGALAANAQRWADQLAAMGRLEHSGSGQNLALATSGTRSVSQLVDLWGDERRHFRNGLFPAVSTTGNWFDVGHYTQLVWRTTTEVGCGLARRNRNDVLVCNYNPAGNVMGERPF
jgi:hypothetical protein